MNFCIGAVTPSLGMPAVSFSSSYNIVFKHVFVVLLQVSSLYTSRCHSIIYGNCRSGKSLNSFS